MIQTLPRDAKKKPTLGDCRLQQPNGEETGVTQQLGSVDIGSLVLTPRGNVPGWPELTGTGSGELWAFFPGTSPPSVRELDKASGTSLQTFAASSIGSGDITHAEAWAFAFWGGRFYIFYQEDSDPSTNVWRLDPADGSITEVLPDTGHSIVGAGVSTCAPVTLI